MLLKDTDLSCDDNQPVLRAETTVSLALSRHYYMGAEEGKRSANLGSGGVHYLKLHIRTRVVKIALYDPTRRGRNKRTAPPNLRNPHGLSPRAELFGDFYNV